MLPLAPESHEGHLEPRAQVEGEARRARLELSTVRAGRTPPALHTALPLTKPLVWGGVGRRLLGGRGGRQNSRSCTSEASEAEAHLRLW